MIPNWTAFQERLETFPQGSHMTRPPISVKRLNEVQKRFENLPGPLLAMVKHFNGAELFARGMPMLTLFGLTEDPPLDEMEWAEDWYIDVFTPKWRGAEEDRESQFVFGMTNYGGVIIYDEEIVKEWDTAQRTWLPEYEFEDWLEKVLQDGDTMLRELEEG
jgi:hypothetical protein